MGLYQMTGGKVRDEIFRRIMENRRRNFEV